MSLVYVPVLVAGLLAAAPGAPVPDPYNAVMELLIIPSSLSMVVVFVAVHRWAAPQRRLLSGSAVAAGITICVHGVYALVLPIALLLQGRRFARDLPADGSSS